MKKRKKLLLIDAHALIHRAFHAVPPLTTKNGKPIHAVYGFLLLLIRAIKDIKPAAVAVAFDSPGGTFRDKIYKEYKAHREAPPEELISQFPIVREVVKEFGFESFALKGYEADDIIGTICTEVSKKNNFDIVIATGDMDLSQLINHHVTLLKPQKGVKEIELFDASGVEKKFGVTPAQITDYKGLRGDPSDNIPGVKGIGEKGASDLLQTYETIENIYTHIEKITGRNRKALEGQEEIALLSKKLATICTTVPIDFDVEKMVKEKYDRERIEAVLQKYEFKSLLSQLQSFPGFEVQTGMFAPKKGKEEKTAAVKNADLLYECVDTPEKMERLAKELSHVSIFAFDTETDGLNPLQDPLVGISISFEEKRGYYIPCTTEVPLSLKKILENPKIKKTGHNVKFDMKVLRHAGVDIQGVVFDTMIASFLLHSGSRGHGLDHLAFVEYGYTMQPITDLIGKGKDQITMSQVPVEDVSWYACEDADISWRLYQTFFQRLQDAQLLELFNRFELPTLHALIYMEEAGVRIDEGFLAQLSKKLHVRIRTLKERIHTEAGRDFNISSPTQMKEILFDVLGLSTEKIKKTKTGFSTAASELEKLRTQHPIIPFIEEYRELTKLTSTYIDTLPKLIHPQTGRIHTNYSQTIAATGRLSSNDPNLQNIPIRTELGRSIRQAFIADDGKCILSVDYSQIELRVVAHLSGDAVMTNAFLSGADIHTETAAKLHDVPANDVTKEMRRAAKAINFGILYGMGVQGIMRDSGISRDEAKNFLEKYFLVHTGIKKYIDHIKEKTYADGYAETFFGRKRLLPDIRSSSRMIAAAAERAAVNMPVQGTAADIMKLAMIAVHDAIQAEKIDATMLLQVHDELVFEIEEDRVKKEGAKIKKMMEGVVSLTVPLVVDMEYGRNWGELEEI